MGADQLPIRRWIELLPDGGALRDGNSSDREVATVDNIIMALVHGLRAPTATSPSG